jgi:hypothetical protein
VSETLSKEFEIEREEFLLAPDSYYVWYTHLQPWVDSLKDDYELGTVTTWTQDESVNTDKILVTVEVKVKKRPFPDNVVLGEN